MYTEQPSKLIGEDIFLTFNFLSHLEIGQTLSSPTITVSLFAGVDPTASTILSGAATISGATVTQKIIDGRAGVIYLINCQVNVSNGAVLTEQITLAILSDDGSFVPSSIPTLTGDLPDGIVGAAYSQNLAIAGGYMPYTPATPTGSAPEWMGFTVVDATLVCAGTSSSDALSSYSFNARIQDAALTFATSAQVINLTRTTVAGDFPNDLFIGYTSSFSYTASLGTAPYTFSLVSGSLPTGLTLNSNGSVTGVVGVAAGGQAFSWVVRATDTNGISDDHSDSANVSALEWIGSNVLNTVSGSKDITPSATGNVWDTTLGWNILNYDDCLLLRRDSDGAVAGYNPVSPSAKFGVSFDNGQTFSMFLSVGMNATGHVVGFSGGFWQCCSSSAPTRITDAGTQTQVASAVGLQTMCIANNRIVGFRRVSNDAWHADVTGDNWASAFTFPVGFLGSMEPLFRANAYSNDICMVCYKDLGATLEIYIVWSSNNGVSFSNYAVLTIADPGAFVASPRVWYDAVLQKWAVSFFNRVIFGSALSSLAPASFVFPGEITDIGSDGEKFIFTCVNRIVKTSDFITFTEVYGEGARSAVSVFSS